MEEALGVKYDSNGKIAGKRAVVRYADDLVVFCKSREDAVAVTEELAGWLRVRGLALSPGKTRLVHLTEGFNFKAEQGPEGSLGVRRPRDGSAPGEVQLVQDTQAHPGARAVVPG